ncbi:hypothetical protein [Bacillus halotolerans]|uniref:hypothetical protein n=1 Tax=Bacillus halotolerans TaxID=260554 RepID=UPI003305DB8C
MHNNDLSKLLYYKVIKPLSSTVQELDYYIKQKLKSIDFEKLIEDFSYLKAFLDSLDDVFIKFKKIIIELGYPPNHDYPIDLLLSIIDAYEDSDLEELKVKVDQIMLNYFDDKEIEEMLMHWESRAVLQKRLPIIRNAIKAHKQQMYFASIPTLLPQLEGLVADCFQHKGSMNSVKMKKYLECFLIEKVTPDSYTFKDILYDYYIQNILVRFEHGKDITSDISRHAILHGGDVNYGKQINSLKLILLFDFFTECLCDWDSIKTSKKEHIGDIQ